MIKKVVALLLLVAAVAVGAYVLLSEDGPQEPNPIQRKSPVAISSLKHGGTYIKVVYGQPYKQGREIFGGLVPYGNVWRTGANEATEITTTRDIYIVGHLLSAGTYAMFTIPGPDTWTLIFNAELGQWGAFEYDESRDVLRVEVPAHEKNTVTEVFSIFFTEVVDQTVEMILQWDRTEVHVPITLPEFSAINP